jgi:hypothetical protein
MARAYASSIIEAPVEAVWQIVRDFSALPNWVPGISGCSIEDGLPPDAVGCVRAMSLGEQVIRERLLWLDDSRYRFGYDFETPPFPVKNYVASFELLPVTSGDRTFARGGRSSTRLRRMRANTRQSSHGTFSATAWHR